MLDLNIFLENPMWFISIWLFITVVGLTIYLCYNLKITLERKRIGVSGPGTIRRCSEVINIPKVEYRCPSFTDEAPEVFV